MLNSALADFILARMRIMLNLCMRNLYNAEHIGVSLLFFDKSQSEKIELFSNMYEMEQSTLDKIQDALIGISKDKNEEKHVSQIENLVFNYFNQYGYTHVIIGVYEISSKVIINFISYKDDDYKYIYKIRNNKFNNISYPQSLFDALLGIIKYHLHYFEIKEDINECQQHYNPMTIHNDAAQYFLGIVGAASSNAPSLDLLDSINNFSKLTYENKRGKGRMLFSKVENFHYDVKLKNPIAIKESRGSRKLLEISSENHFLLSDGHKIYGIGSVNEGQEMYVLDVFDISCWQMSHAGKLLLWSEFGKVSVEQRYINDELLARKIDEIFSNGNTAKIVALIDSVSKSGHGSIIIISEGARAESNRLCVTGFLPETFEPNHSLLNQLAKIDGAVLLDQDLHCHGFGIILDGVSVQSQDSSRGSRYNSSLRYYCCIKEKFEKTLIVVTSDDGMVDFIPPMI